MTLDDLVYKFEQTYNGSFSDGQRDIKKAKLLGLRAVVQALRDEIDRHTEGADAYNRFTDILGSDAGEKVPDYIRTDNRVVIDPGTAYCAPATDPSPAVCEWTAVDYGAGWGQYLRVHDGVRQFCTVPNRLLMNGDSCACGNPIAFVYPAAQGGTET